MTVHTEPRYTRIAVLLHWCISALIITNLMLAWVVDALPDDWVRPVIDTHKSVGITVIGLALLRILWRAGHPPPAAPAGHAVWERRLSLTVHLVFYGLMLALPVSGWLHDSAWKDAASHPLQWFGLGDLPRLPWLTAMAPAAREAMHETLGDIHALFADVLYVMLALHVLGALKHQFRDHEAQFRRMWF